MSLTQQDLQAIATLLDTKLEERFSPINVRLDKIDTRLDTLETRLDSLETRMDSLETRFDTLETRFDTLETRFDTLETRFDSLETRFDSLEATVNRNYDLVIDFYGRQMEHNTVVDKKLESLGRLNARIEIFGNQTIKNTAEIQKLMHA